MAVLGPSTLAPWRNKPGSATSPGSAGAPCGRGPLLGFQWPRRDLNPRRRLEGPASCAARRRGHKPVPRGDGISSRGTGGSVWGVGMRLSKSRGMGTAICPGDRRVPRKWPGQGSNLQARRRQGLNLGWLPISPPGQVMRRRSAGMEIGMLGFFLADQRLIWRLFRYRLSDSL